MVCQVTERNYFDFMNFTFGFWIKHITLRAHRTMHVYKIEEPLCEGPQTPNPAHLSSLCVCACVCEFRGYRCGHEGSATWQDPLSP